MESIPNLPELESKTIQYWKSINVVELLKKRRAGSKEWVYYDGPITANNLPHYGHVIQWVLKDLMPRYWSMKGYFVSRNMGWDCQGLPVEIEVERSLGFTEKSDVEKFGVEKFNRLCEESVFKYRDAIYNYETRIGRWFDDEDMYYTMDSSYIESVWWSFKKLYAKGLIYKGLKVVPYSTRGGCSLSQHEVSAGGYKELEDPAVVVRFSLKDEKNSYLLSWTTTPWTIPGNLLLAIGKKVEYVKVKFEKDTYILARKRLEGVFKGRQYEFLGEVSSKDLIGKEYDPPFDFYENKRKEGCFKVVYADHADDEEGTGVVHLAPYGEEDFDVFMKLGIEIFDYLDETARFTKEIPVYEGLFYSQASDHIVNDLREKDCLFSLEKYLHRVPLCWRTSTPLIYKPIESWYVAVTKIKKKLLRENQKINWVPLHLRDGMSKSWLENARDWAISRSRYWGTPMPVWVNDSTGEVEVIGSYQELREKSGVEIANPHKPYVDSITWQGKEGGVFRRIPEVLDVWYDSGSVPFAKLHYPFENKKRFRQTMPAEYIAESTEQVRWWFYTMHVLGVALFNKVPYKNPVTHGIMEDREGKKLSKSKGNYPPMDEVLGNFGADVLRLFILTSPVVQAENTRFYTEALEEVRKQFFLIMWNSLKYYITYAKANGFQPSPHKPVPRNILDRWILVRLQETINIVVEKMDKYLIMEASRQLTPFVNDLSTWYIRRSRDRLREGDKSAFQTLYYVLTEFTKLIAPMLPFLAEEMYEILSVRKVMGLESVHLDRYPMPKKLGGKESALLKTMKNTRDIVSAAQFIRSDCGLGVRQPLSTIAVASGDFFEDLLKDELNVKNVVDYREADLLKKKVETQGVAGKVALDIEITEELEIEGAAREIIRKIQDLRKEKGLNIEDKIEAFYKKIDANEKAVEKFGNEIKAKVLSVSLEPGPEYEIIKKS